MPTPDKIKAFYRSREWRIVSNYIRNKYRYVCQLCGKAGSEVHHKTPLTLRNFDNDTIRIGEDNLILLCRSCHDSQRAGDDRYLRDDVYFDETGDLKPKPQNPSPPPHAKSHK